VLKKAALPLFILFIFLLAFALRRIVTFEECLQHTSKTTLKNVALSLSLSLSLSLFFFSNAQIFHPTTSLSACRNFEGKLT